MIVSLALGKQELVPVILLAPGEPEHVLINFVPDEPVKISPSGPVEPEEVIITTDFTTINVEREFVQGPGKETI